MKKAIKQYVEDNLCDVIFEYAMCSMCIDKMRKKLSALSIQRISEYILNKSDIETRTIALLNNNNRNINDWLSSCLIKGTPREKLPEYQIACQCQGKNMIFSHLPYLISYEAADEMNELLSKQTKEELDNFYRENLGIPPELEELFNKPKILIV